MTRALIVFTLFLIIGEECLSAETNLSPESLLREASDTAATIQEPYSKSAILQSIAIAQLRAGDVQGALKNASAMTVNRSNTLVSVLTAQAKMGNIKGANQTLFLLDEEIARENALGSIAVAYAKAGHTQKAMQLVAQIPDNYAAHSDALVDIASLQAAGGDTEGALKTLADKWWVNPQGAWKILEPRLAAGDIDGALQITSSIQDEYFRSYMLWGVTTRVKDLNRRLGIAASIPTGHARASAFMWLAAEQVAGGDLQGGRSSLLRAVEAIPSIQDIWAKADIQWQIATTFAQAQDVPNARRIAVSIEQSGHRELALKDIITVQAKAMDYSGALETATAENGDKSLTDFALLSIATSQATSDSIPRTLETIGKIRNEGSQGSALGTVAITVANDGNVADALQLSGMLRRRIENAPENLDSPQIPGQLYRGQEQAGLQILLSNIFEAIAKSCAKRGMIQEALGFTTFIREPFFRHPTLQDIALNQVKAGDDRGALEWISASQVPAEKAMALVGAAYGLIQRTGS